MKITGLVGNPCNCHAGKQRQIDPQRLTYSVTTDQGEIRAHKNKVDRLKATTNIVLWSPHSCTQKCVFVHTCILFIDMHTCTYTCNFLKYNGSKEKTPWEWLNTLTNTSIKISCNFYKTAVKFKNESKGIILFIIASSRVKHRYTENKIYIKRELKGIKNTVYHASQMFMRNPFYINFYIFALVKYF